MELNKKQQELMFKFQMFEQQIQQLQQQLQAVEQAIVEANSLNLGLEDLKKGKDKEILASIGKGIFIKAKLTSENLIVDVGAKNFVKKSIPDTQKIITDQIKKLEAVKKELEDNLEKINTELTKTFMDAQKQAKK
ncbi:MAG: prefoldin subunit alpha [archaeon]